VARTILQSIHRYRDVWKVLCFPLLVNRNVQWIPLCTMTIVYIVGQSCIDVWLKQKPISSFLWRNGLVSIYILYVTTSCPHSRYCMSRAWNSLKIKTTDAFQLWIFVCERYTASLFKGHTLSFFANLSQFRDHLYSVDVFFLNLHSKPVL